MGQALHVASDRVDPAVEITGLTADSRRVAPGVLFAALPGTRADGRAFIPEAVAKGAAAVLAPADTSLDPAPAVPVLTADNPRRAFALLAARFHARQPDTVVAVTGTNGKTSTALFTRRIWAALGHAAGSLGTLGASAPGFERPGALTTPDPVLLHQVLAEMAAAGCDHLAMEASSHGLDQCRLDGVRLAAAAFTNLSHDHLDYHGTMDAYRAAKARLFAEVMPAGGVAVLNADAPETPALADLCRGRGHRVLRYGCAADADLRLDAAAPTPDGQDLRLTVLGQPYGVRLALAGGFQALNALAALGLVLATGAAPDAAPDAAVAALETLTGVPGRMQKVATLDQGAVVYVDYAHTPDSLETVLAALRPHAAGRLVCVFGCGGDRDRTKRPVMGAIAARCADIAICTDDNPRTEDPAAIRAAVLAACPGGLEIGDRAAAIRAGVDMLGPGDVLLVAGKGHEPGQIVGDRVLPFDDAEQVRAAVAARAAGEGGP
ncbi:UDP-N-acetylmuramoyl-L-alanyl-D-glutamate--2,6-diaminopimelate ligase [Roseospira goensis]|uniref:UDP-N-acetylmuramoyl-L-alanyl-D-glutamate--2,6-diaminopimelate ligase n=1 Tax=Roseospira goensis TaxID=391922 RepID=A0A7W6S0U3_9PROT|nr:UDP-N-acetylmuramoyl-L-alanyl-D-glutamate--2,6-diaminopimelate ligase [Roseospira goensis]MBB4286646.1 UDP-N-acetylmuramoyl-L-alanyl-D-glutamate--2,6-diaminopimelate ligase [Roseospira goensis]